MKHDWISDRTPNVPLGFAIHVMLITSNYEIKVQTSALQHFDWSAGMTDRSRGVYHSSTPGGSSESINGEDGQGNSRINIMFTWLMKTFSVTFINSCYMHTLILQYGSNGHYIKHYGTITHSAMLKLEQQQQKQARPEAKKFWFLF